MAPPTSTITYALSQFAQHNNAPLHVHFPTITVTKPGASITKATSSTQPSLSISSTMVKLDPSKKYLALLLDLDAPYPTLPLMSPIAHFLQTDLTLSSTKSQKTTDWLSLGPSQEHEAVLPYLPPSPPPLSGAHRYLWLVWEQPDGVTEAQIRTRLEISEKPGMMARVKWDVGGFEKKLGLGEVLAGTYFVV